MPRAKSRQPRAAFLFAAVLLAVCVPKCKALDREAFTFTHYDLQVRVEPEQQRLAVRGKISLRNDSSVAQKNLSLQISSSLSWRAIRVMGKPVQFVSQPYTSDIDHTGSLSEAIVSLPAPVAPKGTVELEIGYEGIVPLDTTRLTQIGAPEQTAKHSDWDQISKAFTAVRGIGYVAWYPIACEAASLTDENSVFETIGRWKMRHADSSMRVSFQVTSGLRLWFSGEQESTGKSDASEQNPTSFTMARFGQEVPTFVIASFEELHSPGFTRIAYLYGEEEAANDFSLASELAKTFVTSWFGPPREKAEVLELADQDAAPFENGSTLLTPFNPKADARLLQMTAVHQLTHAAFSSRRLWIYEGLAHFAQAVYREQLDGRAAALQFMALHGAGVLDAESAAAKDKDANAPAQHSLINTSVPEFYRGKAMYVWWMLRDMLGDETLKKALAGYHADQEGDPAYVQHLVAAQTKRDLEWFFDDWVYRDKGLPDFRVEAAVPRPTVGGGYIVTVTVANDGNAGAEVPIVLKVEGGEVVRRLEVRAKSKSSIRIEAPSAPQQVIVNDGSVPEFDATNNILKVELPTR
ncbi:MAG TPA: hypothetical protein VJQ82_05385 [Terriglobales bacterium]|nr:hypothetical protein [Terriglobales bacterium]